MKLSNAVSGLSCRANRRTQFTITCVAWCLLTLKLNSFAKAASSNEADEYLEKGKQLLAAGQLAQALTQFHSAIDVDPTNYVSFYRRGTVYLGMGKLKAALSDLSRVIELKPDFVAARLQRASVLIKQGNFEDSIKDCEWILRTDQSNTEASTKLDKIYSILNDLGTAKRFMSMQDYGPAIELFTSILESCPWSTEIHEYRSDCYLNLGNLSKAVVDINALAKLIPDNTHAYFRLTELYYSMGDVDLALTNVRECLRLDPDIKKCSDIYKKLRALNKSIEKMKKAHDEQRFDECVTAARAVINQDASSSSFKLKGQSFICSCQSKAKNVKEALEACSESLKHNPNDADALFNRAQAYIADEQLDQAKQDCQKAHEIENTQRTNECVDRINKLIKQSKKRDYYKILGVKRSADKAAIIKAYRKLAQKWHPDRFDDKEEKEKAQKVFIDIAAAKEVLTDTEKRAKFDNGEDPLDAEEQANQGHGHGFNPFQNGFNPFGGGGGGGGGYQFKFKFN